MDGYDSGGAVSGRADGSFRLLDFRLAQGNLSQLVRHAVYELRRNAMDCTYASERVVASDDGTSFEILVQCSVQDIACRLDFNSYHLDYRVARTRGLRESPWWYEGFK